MAKVNIAGLDKANVLAALYNNSRPQGFGALRAKAGDMTVDEARTYLETGDDHAQDFELVRESRAKYDERLYFDYLNGRVLKVDIGGDEFDSWGYDRDLGQGLAERVITRLRETGEISKIS